MRFYEVIIDIIIEGGSGFSEIAIMHFTSRIFFVSVNKIIFYWKNSDFSPALCTQGTTIYFSSHSITIYFNHSYRFLEMHISSSS